MTPRQGLGLFAFYLLLCWAFGAFAKPSIGIFLVLGGFALVLASFWFSDQGTGRIRRIAQLISNALGNSYSWAANAEWEHHLGRHRGRSPELFKLCVRCMREAEWKKKKRKA
jgi:hypothetical protein